LSSPFGKQYEMACHFLEVELNSFDPMNFDNVQYLFTKFKSLLCELIYSSIDKSKQEKQMVLTIMEKLVPYFVYLSPHFTLPYSLQEQPIPCLHFHS
jgi:hypothetical protein